MFRISLMIVVVCLLACQHKSTEAIGSIERLNPALDSLVAPDAKMEVIAEGFEWSEGPLWIEAQQRLIFSDVPKNIIYQWTEKNGKEIYLQPSGFTGTPERGGEMGSNGLLLDTSGRLILCQHGNRQLARMSASLSDPKPVFETIAGGYQSHRFNSPNDAVCRSNGDFFLTDPPYGLLKNMDDSSKEIPYQGVYRVNTKGEVTLLVDSITRPNGIALFPGEKTLLIANSDPGNKNWYAFDFGPNDSLVNPRIFASAQSAPANLKGSPDGMKIDKKGNVFASGPGGIWIFNNSGTLLGKILLPEAVSNCAFSPDQKTLYITEHMFVLRVKLRK